MFAAFWAAMPLIGWGEYDYEPLRTCCTLDYSKGDRCCSCTTFCQFSEAKCASTVFWHDVHLSKDRLEVLYNESVEWLNKFSISDNIDTYCRWHWNVLLHHTEVFISLADIDSSFNRNYVSYLIPMSIFNMGIQVFVVLSSYQSIAQRFKKTGNPRVSNVIKHDPPVLLERGVFSENFTCSARERMGTYTQKFHI